LTTRHGEHLFDEIKRYVEFTSDDERRLRALLPQLQPAFSGIIDDFYEHILNHPGASGAITGGTAQVERLKGTLRIWLARVFAGPWDEAYYEQSARIGRRHVQINLPQQYMFTAVDVIRLHLTGLVLKNSAAAETEKDLAAVNRILDMELAIHLHTYREDYLLAVQRSERLATFGQLVASIGHELRNPLGVMESSVYLLRSRVPATDAVTRHLDKIEAQIKLSNRIITDLLDMVRERPANRSDTLLAPLIAAAVESAQHAGVTTRITTVLEERVPMVHTDASQIQQVLVNLLSNAMDAAGAGGEVRVDVALDGQVVVLRVEDSGAGIDPTVRARLFEPLVTTKARGVGLGLALCRKMVQRNGGTIALVPPRTLQGAAFELRLPMAGG